MAEPTEEPMAEPTEEPMDEPTEEPMDEPTEEPMAEASATLNGIETCDVAQDGPFAGVDPSGTSIVWWHQHSGSREEQLIPMVEDFNASNACGITVDPQNQGGYDDIRDKVNASISAGELPAALVVGYQNDQAFYQLNDALVDLNPYVDDPVWGLSEEDVNAFYDAFWQQSVHPAFDNQRLGIPPNRSMEVLYYNQTWLEELGFDGPPTTPEEFRDMACAAAAEKGDGTGGFIFNTGASSLASWTFAFGGNVLSEDGQHYSYDNDATIQALAFLKDLYDDGCGYLFTEGYPDPEFAARRAIFTMGSSSGLPFYGSGVEDVAAELGTDPDNWGVTAIPHTTAEPVQNIYGGDVMVTSTTPEQQLAAWIFAKWFTLPENQARWVEISGYFPTRRDTQEYLEGYVEENPQWGSALDLLEYGNYEPQLISYQSVRDQAEETFNAVLSLPADVGVDNTDAIVGLLQELTDFANTQQDELMAEIE
jgi:multiple sugar transport system substrate-binding protein/sn-glycerol 3-phosphate transport system substrate-binding protein